LKHEWGKRQKPRGIVLVVGVLGCVGGGVCGGWGSGIGQKRGSKIRPRGEGGTMYTRKAQKKTEGGKSRKLEFNKKGKDGQECHIWKETKEFTATSGITVKGEKLPQRQQLCEGTNRGR